MSSYLTLAIVSFVCLDGNATS